MSVGKRVGTSLPASVAVSEERGSRAVEGLRRVAFSAVLIAATASLPHPALSRSRTEHAVVQVAYEKPKTVVFDKLRTELQEKRALERAQDVLSTIRLPRSLMLRAAECGTSNAWYDPDTRTVTICYEYVAEVVRNAPEKVTAVGVTREATIFGPVLMVILHETAHAIFDLLQVPILGHEEDAADEVATFVLLHLGKQRAREVIDGNAVAFAKDAKEHPVEKEDFADDHGQSGQRFYNLICLAYGFDSKTFGYVVEKGYLPKWRAEQCGAEYDAAAYAFDRLIAPAIRMRSVARARLRKDFD